MIAPPALAQAGGATSGTVAGTQGGAAGNAGVGAGRTGINGTVTTPSATGTINRSAAETPPMPAPASRLASRPAAM